eukprot:CAMPEP_0177579910 /NCGR_PEP_ID=MMETSP0419_2-20121207/1236_1 /TAXON_ID=582737 /ORGANISM="Tetraselmis sp., Strain GSL018" /LENGTH=381 /DNA_ID=CAMNT_0019068657 /DNA_START=699 /DNA_END=1840 /DNA_ORIENTATION=-
MIWGESYAGVYVPTLAEIIVDVGLPLNFLGFAVGDPCTAERYQHLDGQLHFNLRFAKKYGFISGSAYTFLSENCLETEDGGSRLVPSYSKPGCRKAWRLYYLATSSNDGYGPFSQLPEGGFLDPYTGYGPHAQPYDVMLAEYLNWDPVKRALHVTAAEADTSQTLRWETKLKYTKQYLACFYEEETSHTEKPRYPYSMLSIYRKLAGRVRSIVVFNGDTDPDVQFRGTEAAVQAIGLPVAEGGSWRPWFFQQSATPAQVILDKPPYWGMSLSRRPLPGAQLAGYVTDYENNVSFVTVHGSGHLVPMFQPEAALHLFQRVLLGQELSPRLNMSSVDSLPDGDFFGSGYMARWVRLAQSDRYAGQQRGRPGPRGRRPGAVASA